MTPAARAAAAIEVLDRIAGGQNIEVALTNWGRANRYAGSGDRAALRDIVFDVLRCRRSFAAAGGGETGYDLVLGWARESGQEALFSGEKYAPPLPAKPGRPPVGLEALDCPNWLGPVLGASLGADFLPVMLALRQRAPVFLRVNLAKTTRDGAIGALAAEGVTAEAHPLCDTALQVVNGARKVQASGAFSEGLVELQDASSQAVVGLLPLRDGMRVLDYCAGGGGKTLAMAPRARLRLFAHDAEPRRMSDLPLRAKRAGAKVTLVARPEEHAPFDLVLTDVPCSGSGSWRRDPQGKWALTQERLAELTRIQAAIMDHAATLVQRGGVLAYATCSLIEAENSGQIGAFLARHDGWTLENSRQFTPLEGGDGFFVAILRAP